MSNTVTGYRLSAQQERIWSLGTDRRAQCEVLLEGPLDISRLRRAFRDAVGGNEILRTVFQRQAGLKVPFQVITDEVAFSWRTADEPGRDGEHALSVVVASLPDERRSLLIS